MLDMVIRGGQVVTPQGTGCSGGFWAMKMSSDPGKYMDQYATLSAKYATAFTGAKAGSDIDF